MAKCQLKRIIMKDQKKKIIKLIYFYFNDITEKTENLI